MQHRHIRGYRTHRHKTTARLHLWTLVVEAGMDAQTVTDSTQVNMCRPALRAVLRVTLQEAARGPRLRRPEGCRDLARSVRTTVQQFAAEHGGIASDDSPFPRYWCAHRTAALTGSLVALVSCRAVPSAGFGRTSVLAAPALLLGGADVASWRSIGRCELNIGAEA